MNEQHHTGANLRVVTAPEHRPIHPAWWKRRAQTVTSSRQVKVPGLVDDLGIRVKDIAEGVTGFELGGRSGMSIQCERMEIVVSLARSPGEDGSHHGRVVEPINACPFDGELVLGTKVVTPAHVSSGNCPRTRIKDKFVTGVISVSGEDRALHRGQDIPTPSAGNSEAIRFNQRGVCKLAGSTTTSELCLALYHPKLRHQVGGIFQTTEIGKRGLHASVVQTSQAIGVEFDTETSATRAVLLENVF